MADIHFNIEKNIENEKTTTNVYKLNFNQQIDELARMLGGASVTALTRNHAEEMLHLAEVRKNKI
jgi:DNA repair protein RecN (Recombination protein N)